MTAYRAHCIETGCPWVGPVRASDVPDELADRSEELTLEDDPAGAAEEDATGHIKTDDHGVKVVKVVQNGL